MQKVRGQGHKSPPTVCRHPVSGSLSPPSSGCFSPFPHGTCSLSVVKEYLGLEGGPPIFRQDFSCPALLEDDRISYPYGAVTRSGATFQTLPVQNAIATGLVPVRSPLLRESLLMSFPPATEMFQFAGFASTHLSIQRADDPKGPGFPIRISTDQRLLAAPRGFSQRATSFLAS